MRKTTQLILFVTFALLPVIGLHEASAAQTGKRLYEQKCGRCHITYEPIDYAPEEWPGIVRSMRAQAALTNADIEQISDYLVSASGEGDRSSSTAPYVGGYLYTEYFQSPEKVKNYDIHYLAVYLSGWASETIAYFGEFELEHGGKGDNTFVEQAYIDYWMLPNIGVKVGAILTPFNRFDDFHDPLSNYTITRPQSARAIGVSAWKDVGVDIHGYVNIHHGASVGFNVYTINGLGDGSNLRGSRQYRDNNEDKAFGGRLDVLWRDILEIGGSVYNGAWDDAGRLDLTMAGGHLLVHTTLMDLYGEVAVAESENPAGVKDGEMSGFFVQASRLLDRHYRPTLRYGALDYLDRGKDLGRDPDDGDLNVSELALAFAWYPVSRVTLKAEYTVFTEGSRTENRENNQFGLQAAVRF